MHPHFEGGGIKLPGCRDGCCMHCTGPAAALCTPSGLCPSAHPPACLPLPAPLPADKPPFVIVIPPPNVTGSLHIGHALTNAIEVRGGKGARGHWRRCCRMWLLADVPGTRGQGAACCTCPCPGQPLQHCKCPAAAVGALPRKP